MYFVCYYYNRQDDVTDLLRCMVRGHGIDMYEAFTALKLMRTQ